MFNVVDAKTPKISRAEKIEFSIALLLAFLMAWLMAG